MIDNQKCKISTLAKDLNIKSKDLLELFASLGMEGRKHSSTVEAEEFNVIIEALSSKKQINNFEDYISGKAKIARTDKPSSEINEEKASPAQTPATKKAEIKPAQQEKNQEQKIQEQKIQEQKIQGQKNQEQKKPQAEAAPQKSKSDEKYSGRPAGNRSAADASRFDKRPDFDKDKDRKKEKDIKRRANDNKPSQAQPAIVIGGSRDTQSGTVISDKSSHVGKTRVVDTRGTDVDLSKYDEKLEKFTSDSSSSRRSGNFQPDRQKMKKQGGQNQRGNFGNSRRDKEKTAMDKIKQQELERARKQQLTVSIPDEISVGELASRLKVTASEVIKRLMLLGVMANVNQIIDYDTAYLVADELGAKVNHEVTVTIEEKLFNDVEDKEDELEPRAPVVVVMGHVDHGKTSILDAIRHTNVTTGEAGGITQHIGAYRVVLDGQPITFLDTPGHEAFTAMRARGAKATDIAILVVAADDGIMPQTIEAINHAKAAGLDIVVAINKMDKQSANPDMVKQELTKYELIPEEWGGDVICVPVSALTRKGIDQLLESVLMVAEMKELKANPNRRAKGIVIEAKLDKGRGPVATVLVQNGTLKIGDTIIAGTAVGRVRAMKDDKGANVMTAGPSVPVEIIGLSAVPTSGDEFNAVEDERMARELAETRKQKLHDAELNANAKVSLDDLFAQISDGAKELKIIVKADVVGSAEAVKLSLEKLSNEEVKVKVIHCAVGGITEGDVMLAAASNAIIVGFSVRPDKNAIDSAERQKVDVRTYRIIYECIEEITAAMKGLLAPVFKEQLLGHAEVRQLIRVPNVGIIAGCYILDGKINRKGQVRVLRDSVVIFEDKIESLRRFKEDVKEVAEGYECGIGLEKFNDIKENDILEVFEMVEVKQ